MEFCSAPDSQFTSFCSFLTGISLDSVFSSGLYTIFAPTNEVFEDFDESFTDVRVATRILLQHIISGSAIEKFDESEFPCDGEIEMANGDFNKVTCREGMPYIGGPGNTPESTPGVLDSKFVGCNFVLYSIDKLILPE